MSRSLEQIWRPRGGPSAWPMAAGQVQERAWLKRVQITLTRSLTIMRKVPTLALMTHLIEVWLGHGGSAHSHGGRPRGGP
jgi:hypothetical protein